jgi:hypothetical protein
MNEQKKRQCRFAKRNGGRCQANAMLGSDSCFFHCPAVAAKRTQARREGGRRNKAPVLPEDTPEFSLLSAGDVVSLIADTINRTRRGQLDPRVGNTIGYLSGVLLKALETGDHERRLSDLESVVRDQSFEVSVFDGDKSEFVTDSGSAG